MSARLWAIPWFVSWSGKKPYGLDIGCGSGPSVALRCVSGVLVCFFFVVRYLIVWYEASLCLFVSGEERLISTGTDTLRWCYKENTNSTPSLVTIIWFILKTDFPFFLEWKQQLIILFVLRRGFWYRPIFFSLHIIGCCWCRFPWVPGS